MRPYPGSETRTGVVTSSIFPLPSWPLPPSPQQYAAPSVVTPQVMPVPALIDAKVSPPETGVGWSWSAVEPLPSWPLKSQPQQ